TVGVRPGYTTRPAPAVLPAAVSAGAEETASCPTKCVDQGIVYTRSGAAAPAAAGDAAVSASARGALPLPDLAKLPSLTYSERYSAQRKPRLTVLAFSDA